VRYPPRMMRWAARLFCIFVGLTGSVALAQRMGGGSRAGGSGGAPGGQPSPQQSAEERSRAANAKQWADDIEKMRAQAPPPPLPTIRFPTENEKLLGRLRWAEDPKKDLAAWLDKLWKDGKEPTGRRVALETFWHDAEKPKWARAAIEDYYRKHAADGAALHPPEPAVDAAKPAATTATATATATGSTAPATAVPPPPPGPAPPPATIPSSGAAKPTADR
jgi:hypothetical protein